MTKMLPIQRTQKYSPCTSTENARKPKMWDSKMQEWTRKSCYRKDDRAMRPIYMDALKNFGSPWLRPRLLFPKLLNGLLLWSIVWKCVQNLKFVTLPVP